MAPIPCIVYIAGDVVNASPFAQRVGYDMADAGCWYSIRFVILGRIYWTLRNSKLRVFIHIMSDRICGFCEDVATPNEHKNSYRRSAARSLLAASHD